MLSGDNSILQRATEAKEKNKESAVYEQLDLINIAWVSEEKTNKDANMENFLLEQKEKGEIDDFKDNEDGTYTITKDGYERTIKDTKTQYYTITKIYEDKTEIQKVKSGDNTGKITYKEKEGFYFIDWSTNSATSDFTTLKKKERADFSNVSEDMTVYPKYMSKEYLKVKFLPFEDKQGTPKNLYIITAVDNNVYSELGFDYWVNGDTKKYNASRRISHTFSVIDEASGQKYSYGAADNFDVPSGFIVNMDFKEDNSLELPEDTEIKVIPYFIRMDGSKITGTEKTVKFNEIF